MKKSIIIFLMMILWINGCSNKSSSNNIKKYSELPIKKDLTYFFDPKNIAGQVITRIEVMPLSAYEQGYQFSSGKDFRKEELNKIFYIDRYQINAVLKGKINSKNFSEFEIDDFENKLKKEFDRSKIIARIKDFYKNTDKHIRIVNLNIPVSYSKIDKSKVAIKIKDPSLLKKFNYLQKMKVSDFIKQEIDNNYISKYIVDSKTKCKFKSVIEYDYSGSFSDGFTVQGDPKVLNEIGKKNKGRDSITELTLRVFYSQYITKDQYVTNLNSHETHFVITSFKLKSVPNKRFVTDYYIDKIDSINSFDLNYNIKNNEVDIAYSNKK